MIPFLYRVLLRACPPEVRADIGSDMAAIAAYGIELQAGRRGPAGRAWAVCCAFADLAIFTITVRRDERERRKWRVAPAGFNEHPQPRRPIVLARDIRSALRVLKARPGFSAAVILMLALGIGSTAAIFSVVNGVLLKPIELPEPDRVVQIFGTLEKRAINEVSLSAANTWDIRDRSHAFTDIGAAHSAAYSLTGDGAPERVSGARVSVGFLRALGAAPLAGRIFAPGEDEPGAVAERVILSDALWARRFNRSPSAIGQTITLDGRSYQVIGVLPHGPWWLDGPEVYTPFIRDPKADRDSWEFDMAGRIKPGVTVEAALADLKGVAISLQSYKENEGFGLNLRRSAEWAASPDLRRTLWLMLGAVLLLLAIASVNVANLLMVRASARARERAVRTALGAGRADLIRESLTESMLFSVIGAIAGTALAYGMLKAFKAADPGDIPRLAGVQLDAVVWAFTLGITMLVGLTTGLIPALRTPFGNVVTALRDGQRGSIGDRRQDRTRAVFVAVEVALSVLLLIGAGLLVRSLTNTLNAERGFATDHRLWAEVTLPGAYPVEKRAEMTNRILDDVAALPDVVHVASVSGPMLVGGGTGMGFAPAESAIEASQIPWATWRLISKDYFNSLGLKLMAGRNFDEHDIAGKPWRVIISERLAKRVWPGQNAIGRTARLWAGQSESKGEVIGVVSDIREHQLDSDPTLEVYIPVYGAMGNTAVRLVMQTRGEPEAIIPSLRAAIAAIDPSLPLSRTRSLEDLVSRSVATRRFTMMLLMTFAGLALLLALAGVAGVLMYSMSRRVGEMGLRMALGAVPGRLVLLSLRQGLMPVIVGLVIGGGAAFWVSRLMTSLLYGITPADPATYIAATAVLFLAAALACYMPARRVLRIDPGAALRE
jgi:predicted permease